MIRNGHSTLSWETSLGAPEQLEDRAEHAGRVFGLLRAGRLVKDSVFDHIYPTELRKLSRIHWTPVHVARRAVELLVRDGSTRVLDVGSGAGKFCLVGALTSPGHFHGIEQREYFARFATNLARRHALPRVDYWPGNMADLDWSHFDAFYLFNPFHENIVEEIRIDRFVSISEARHERYVKAVRAKLAQVRVGARVVTFHGFGGEFPPGFRKSVEETHGTGALELWVKE